MTNVRVIVSNHARERIDQRLASTEQSIVEQVAEAHREARFSRSKPKWLQRFYGRGRGNEARAEFRYLRFTDGGEPACAVVAFNGPGTVVVVTVIRQDERTVGMQTFHNSFTSADRARPGLRRRHRARYPEREDVER